MEAFSEFDLEAIFDDEPPPPDRSYHGLARSGETAARAAESSHDGTARDENSIDEAGRSSAGCFLSVGQPEGPSVVDGTTADEAMISEDPLRGSPRADVSDVAPRAEVGDGETNGSGPAMGHKRRRTDDGQQSERLTRFRRTLANDHETIIDILLMALEAAKQLPSEHPVRLQLDDKLRSLAARKAVGGASGRDDDAAAVLPREEQGFISRAATNNAIQRILHEWSSNTDHTEGIVGSSSSERLGYAA